jgi:hypothetical protein
MRVSEAKRCFLDYHRMNSKTNTIRNYGLVPTRFCDQFGERDLESISSDEILSYKPSMPVLRDRLQNDTGFHES